MNTISRNSLPVASDGREVHFVSGSGGMGTRLYNIIQLLAVQVESLCQKEF